MTTIKDEKINLSQSLKELEGITTWFDEQDGIGDVEIALEKVQRASELIKTCNKRLTDVENKFEEIQRGLDSELTPKEEVNF